MTYRVTVEMDDPRPLTVRVEPERDGFVHQGLPGPAMPPAGSPAAPGPALDALGVYQRAWAAGGQPESTPSLREARQEADRVIAEYLATPANARAPFIMGTFTNPRIVRAFVVCGGVRPAAYDYFTGLEEAAALAALAAFAPDVPEADRTPDVVAAALLASASALQVLPPSLHEGGIGQRG